MPLPFYLIVFTYILCSRLGANLFVEKVLLYTGNFDRTVCYTGVYNIRPTDHVTITHQFVQLPDHVNLGGNYEPTESGQLPQYGVDPHLYVHE